MNLCYVRLVLIFSLIQSAVFAMQQEQPYFVKEGVRLGIKLPLQNPFEEKLKGPEADSKEAKRLGVFDCLICHEENSVKVGDSEMSCNVKLACKHDNCCVKCIFEWKAKKGTCPTCRSEIVIKCPLCKDDFRSEEQMTQFNCGHLFCAICANRQILANPQHPTCSICKQRIKLAQSPVASPRVNNGEQNNEAEQGPIKQAPASNSIPQSKEQTTSPAAVNPPQPQQGGLMAAVWGIFSLNRPSPVLARRILNKPSNWTYGTRSQKK